MSCLVAMVLACGVLAGCVFDRSGLAPQNTNPHTDQRADQAGFDGPRLDRDRVDGHPDGHADAEPAPPDVAPDQPLGPCHGLTCPLGCNTLVNPSRCNRVKPTGYAVAAFHDQLTAPITASTGITINTDNGSIHAGTTVIRPANQQGQVLNGIYWGVDAPGSGYPEVSMFGATRLDVPPGVTLTVVGTHALSIYAVQGISITGTLQSRASGQSAGPGGFGGGAGNGGDGASCLGGEGKGGKSNNQVESGGGGGGGGAAGGAGSIGKYGMTTVSGGAGGPAVGTTSLWLLLGGCGGGGGGGPDWGQGGHGGGGGGALQLVAGGAIIISGTITVAGAGGEGAHNGSGGGGAGAGGSVLVEGISIAITGTGIVAANGGGGGSGGADISTNTSPAGEDGLSSTTAAKGGPTHPTYGGAGGAGGALALASGSTSSDVESNGGGGGGAAGRVRLNAPAITINATSTSPAPAKGTVSVW